MTDKDLKCCLRVAIKRNETAKTEAYKEFAEKIIDKRTNTNKYGEVVLLTDIYDTLKELGCE